MLLLKLLVRYTCGIAMFAVLIFTTTPLSAQKPDRTQMDEIYGQLDSLHKVLYTFNYTNVEKNAQSFHDFPQVITRLSDQCAKINFNDGYYRSQTLLQMYHSNLGDNVTAINILNEAIAKAQRDDKAPFEAQFLYHKGVYFKRFDETDSAIYYMEAAYDRAGEIGYTGVQGAAINVIAAIYAGLREFDKSLEFYKKALVLTKESGEVGNTGAVYGNLGLAYARLNMGDSAVYWGEKELIYAKEKEVPGHLQQALNVLTMGSYLTGNYDDVLKYSNQLYEMVEPLDEMGYMVTPYLYRAKTWKAKGMKARAVEDIERSIEIAKEVGFADGEITSLEWYIAELKADKDFEKALIYLERLTELKEAEEEAKSLVNLDKLELRYELKKKESSLQNLRDLQEATDAKVRFRNLLIAAVIVLFSLAIVFMVWIHRRKAEKQQAEIQEAQNRLLRSQLNPHFLFNALSSIQHFLINKGQGIEALEYLSKFAKLMRRILENSRESFVSLEDEISTLRNYLDIQKMRFDGKFNYRIQIDTERPPDEIMIPPMFAQPFIENSLEHGIAKKIDGEIHVLFEEKDSGLYFKVEDNGVGLKVPEKVATEEEHRSLATVITKDRIKLLKRQLGKKASFTMRNKQDVNKEITGTEVIFELPIMYR